MKLFLPLVFFRSSCSSFFEDKGKSSYPWSRLRAEGLRFWPKEALQKAGHDVCQGTCFGQWFRDKRLIMHAPTHGCIAYNNDDLETYAKLIMHAPMWTLKLQVCGHVTLRLRIQFSYLKSTQCFQKMLFYQFMHSSESVSGA